MRREPASGEPTTTVKMNTNRVALHSWLERRELGGGEFTLVGMGRRIEYDSKTGEAVSDTTAETGIQLTSFDVAKDPEKDPWWLRPFKSIVEFWKRGKWNA